MHLTLPQPAPKYKSPTQQVRVSTEPWAAANLYCPNCPSPRLDSLKTNTPASDFICPRCKERFQLKSGKSPFKSRIPDAAYSKMIEAIRKDETPSIFALHYDPVEWRVRNLILIPRFTYSLKDIFKRQPLSSTAQRHDWVGCDILLGAIPHRARIQVISDGVPISPRGVRQEFQRLSPLQRIQTKVRGWTLDVLLILESFGKPEFTLDEVYAHEAKLRALHLLNRHVRPKIRQQLQVLRDMGLLEFIGRGKYRLV
ncbi:MAG TPA: DpnI domain-containing protein [Candidatus Sulfotelmatobacter sp.]|nr:DpnI domain-containing protein [Candidatus Sulfotelmatobacter sp.]